MENKNDRPNIIFIQNDHQAYYGHGMNGGVKPFRPNFDNLASEGALFENAYCTTPLCAPTRRTMATGDFTHTHKQYYNYCNEPFSETYLEVLNNLGYDNYYYGKWHAGSIEPLKQFTKDMFTCENYGNPYITEEYNNYCKRLGIEKATHKVEWAFTMDQYEDANYFPKLKTGANYSCESNWCGEHAIGETITNKMSHECFFIANMACERLEKLAKEKNGNSFSLRVDFWGPHQPFFPTREFIDMYDPKQIEAYPSLYSDLKGKPDMYKIEWTIPFGQNNKLPYPTPLSLEQWQFILSRVYAQITMVDYAGGMILDKIKELELDKNTLVVWTTDHGDSIASNGGHFDKGSHMCEEVMRIPLAMKWEGVIPSGSVKKELVSTIDYPVTLLDAAGGKFRDNKSGRSILDLFKEKASDWRESIMCESFGHGHGENHISKMIRMGDYKLIYHHEEAQINELYNLKDDPYEMSNIYYDNIYSNVKDLMIKELFKWLEKTNDEILNQQYFL